MSALTLRLLVLFLPGVLSGIIAESLTSYKSWSTFRLMLYSAILGMASYGLVSLVFVTWGGELTFWTALVNPKVDIAWVEIGYASIAAVLLAVAVSIVANYNIVYRVARKVRVSSRFKGDIWQHVMNSPDVSKSGWMYVRDKTAGLTYRGWVQFYSDEHLQPRELFLVQVTVFDTDGLELYKMPAIYLSKAVTDSDIVIEFPEYGKLKLGDEGTLVTSSEENNGQ